MRIERGRVAKRFGSAVLTRQPVPLKRENDAEVSLCKWAHLAQHSVLAASSALGESSEHLKDYLDTTVSKAADAGKSYAATRQAAKAQVSEQLLVRPSLALPHRQNTAAALGKEPQGSYLPGTAVCSYAS